MGVALDGEQRVILVPMFDQFLNNDQSNNAAKIGRLFSPPVSSGAQNACSIEGETGGEKRKKDKRSERQGGL